MNESILKALMQLFAIGASLEQLTRQNKSGVEKFLRQQLSLQRIPEYLALFDLHLESLTGTQDPTKTQKKIAVSSVKALRICTEINKELTLQQKYIVFIRLAEFMNSSGQGISAAESEFLETVADVFNIHPELEKLLRALTDAIPDPAKLDHPAVLLLHPKNTTAPPHVNEKVIEELDSTLWMVYIQEAGYFFLRYTGFDIVHVNGKLLESGSTAVFTQGAVLRGQKILPFYFNDALKFFIGAEKSSEVRLNAMDLEFHFPNGHQGLHRLNFTATSGELVGIMGGSGAGKSTLLNVLNGTAAPSSGHLLLNGKDIYLQKNIREGLIGNIPQDDLLIEELSVFQNLYYNARLVFGNLEDEEIRKRVSNVLDALGLSEIQHLKIGSPLNKTISGGQRKRLNIALELVREPAVLFVDEPTSGLSSRDAENVMDLLKQLSLNGKLIFVVIHQPSSDIFRMFDKLLVLDAGGFPVYYGNAADSLIWFKKQVHHANAEEGECPACGNINAEQLFNILEQEEVDEYGRQTGNRKISPAEWNAWYQEIPGVHQHASDTELELPEIPNRKAGLFQQWRIFFTRDFLSKISNRQYLFINLLEAPVLAAVLAFLLRYSLQGEDYNFSNNPNIPAYIFIGVIVALFLGLSISAEEIIRDRKILQREKFLHLSRNSYLFSKIFLLFAVSAIQCASFVLIGNYILGIKEMMLDYWWVLFSLACFSNMLGLNISSGLNSVVTIYILIPFLLIPQILLSGVIVKFEKLNPLITNPSMVPLTGNIMASRWAFEALAVQQFSSNKFAAPFFQYDVQLSEATFKKDWWLPLLKERIDRAELMLDKNSPKDSVSGTLQLVYNELKKENKYNLGLPLQSISKPIAAGREQLHVLRSDLNLIRDYYIKIYNSKSDRKEALIASMNSTPELQEKFMQTRNNYYNESLDQMVRNANEQERVRIYGDEIIRFYEPALRQHPAGGTLNDPFYVPVKSFFGKTMSTYSVNLIMIWLMTLVLYITLRFDWLRKAIGGKF